MPSDVLVTTSRSFYDSYWHELYLVGVILNNTASSQHIEDIVVTFYNAQGAIVGSCSPYPMAQYMAPGQKAPFKQRVYDEPVGWVRYTVEVYHDEMRYAALASSFSKVNTLWDARGDLHIMGRITNEDSRETSLLKVYVTLYDPADEIVNCERTYHLPDLDPGQSATFDIDIDSHQPTHGWSRFELGAHSFAW